ncbi:4-amino-4-deoxy-L-arabinose transferase-like glycosyltransferase [Saccharopolyspora lacisalsi]|uniref:4-amino-4-deoxy-L-arabinose transferase-like glycosyltransferase n=1 Tax=Halosaccharopolyspora lacisalsi TaxID=1000566 RepID=A0A839DR67_9PSEU|nr:glycosyltransferase family 39 protein [Halosaccharopolyspora lacisalsi]MBA8823229.1 4-amino-4-deoxy-L-arabinose transferase-like glycosyltransferase [Halosaccharopolyspora lacisalsi]
MTATTSPTAASSDPERKVVPTGGRFRYRIALVAVCVLAGSLYAWGIGDSWGNSYYSAAVESMSRSFENFLLGSFDPAGVITVDKPPMALWAQVVSVWILGYSPVALLLPQVLEGVAAVFLLHRTVRLWAGEHAALLAALVMAVTPITVAINRDNNPDTLLVLLVIAAAYALTRSIRTFVRGRSTWWLVLSAFLLGCGFLTKMLQAWIVVPVFVLAYLVGSRDPWPRRLLDLGAAAVTLLAGSFWWVAATALWPEPKPYIGGSENGSAWNLIIGYNGLGRIFGQGGGAPGGSGGPGGGGPGGGPGGGGGFGGQAGPLRLFNEQLAGQISWLLPLCLFVLVTMLVVALRRWRGGMAVNRERAAGWVLWGGWLLLVGAVFSFAEGTLHPYYTTMLAPAVGALVGAGLVRFGDRYRRSRGLAGWLLPAGVALTVVWAVVLVLRTPDWNGWAAPVVGALGGAAVLALALGRWNRAVFGTSLVLSLVAVLFVPVTWSTATALGGSGGMGGTNPTAGPSTGGPMGGRRPGGPGDAAPGRAGPAQMSGRPGQGGPMAGGSLSERQQRIVDYVSARAGDREIPLMSTSGAHGASSYIIHTDLTVVGMGGFTGGDDAPTVEQLTRWQRAGRLGFVLVGGGFGGPGGGDVPGRDRASGGTQSPGGGFGRDTGRTQWVRQSCTPVDSAAVGSEDGSSRLYDCR